MIKAGGKLTMQCASYECGESDITAAASMSLTTKNGIHMMPGHKFEFPNGKFITVGTECTIRAFDFADDVLKITDMDESEKSYRVENNFTYPDEAEMHLAGQDASSITVE